MIKRYLATFTYIIVLAFSLHAQSGEPYANNYLDREVSQLQCNDLQIQLEKYIETHPQLNRLAEQNRLAIGVVDLRDSEATRYAGINDNHMMYAASLPKIAILYAAIDAIERGDLENSPEVQNDLKLMISKSNNQASTRMIDRIGYENIEASLRRAEHSLYDESTGGGLWVGKRYASGGQRYPDPLKGISHAATTRQVCSFYYQLVTGKLITPKRSKEILEYLKDPKLYHKFVNTLQQIAPEATLYRKSGSWKQYHSDSVLVWGPERKYILVALVEDGSGEQIIRNLVKPIEEIINNSRP